MTTTYNAPGYTNKNPVSTHGLAKDLKSFHDTVIVTAALGLNDGGSVGWLPPNAVFLGGWAKFATAMDTNGSPTLTVDLGVGAANGVAAAPQQFLAADTTARAGGVQRTFATGAYGYKNTTGVKVPITWLAHAAAATGAAGTIEVHFTYVIEEPATSG